MGHKHSRESLLDAALAVVAREGLHRLSFGKVAAEAGTSDRVVVYYFATKDGLVEAVLGWVGEMLRAGLAPALAGEPAAGHRDLVGRAWVLARDPSTAPLVATYVEALGLAAAGVAPYTTAASEVVEAWTLWFAEHLVGDPAARRAEALAALALLDGLLVVRTAGGVAAADVAARALGVATP